MNIAFNYNLLQTNTGELAGRVYMVQGQTRHWITDGAWLTERGISIQDDVKIVDQDVIANLEHGRNSPMILAEPVDPNFQHMDTNYYRAWVCKNVVGHGIEFGAASNPLPMPLESTVEYADILSYEELLAVLYPGQSGINMIRPTHKLALDTINMLEKNFDFIGAAHVIEHTRDPIGAIARSASNLAPDGQLILFVPDMRMTFDKDRVQTNLAHLIEDFYDPSYLRDMDHFKEFYSLAFKVPAEEYEQTWQDNWKNQFPIHYHTWTKDSFETMVRWIIESLRCFRSYEMYDLVGNEFAVVLRK